MNTDFSRTRSRRRGVTAMMVAALAMTSAACTDGADPSGSASRQATFDTTACPDDVAAVVLGDVSCGFLVVPEDRSKPDRSIKVFVARIAPPKVEHQDPMVVVGTDLGGLSNYGGVAPLAQRTGREVIVLDTRGAGHSQPSLACPEIDELRSAALGTATDDPDLRVSYLEAVGACHSRLSDAGVEPSEYHLEAMAADVEDLRVALGVDEWNVVAYGTSSRIAWEMLRSAPGHLRSVLLDSPEVPGVDHRETAAETTRTALHAVLDNCAADAACVRAFPDVQDSLDAALQRLAAEPARLDVEGEVVRLDDALMLRFLRTMLSDAGSSGSLFLPASVPAVLDLVAAGKVTSLASAMSSTLTNSPPYCLGYQPKCLVHHRMTVGVVNSVLCRDIAPFHDEDQARRAAGNGPGFGPAYARSHYLDVCDAWPVEEPTSDEIDTPVEADVPVMIASGAFASYTPKAGLEMAAAGLSKLTRVVDPAGGHNIMSSDCVLGIRGAWLENLALTSSDQACLADRVTRWVTDSDTMLGEAPAPNEAAETSAPSDAVASTAELVGEWEVSVSRVQRRAALERGGFPELATDFFKADAVPQQGARMRFTLTEDTCAVAYHENDAWYVGWGGPVEHNGTEVVLRDQNVPDVADTLAWRVRGDRITRKPLSSTGDLLKGVPAISYLAANAWQRVE